MKKLITMLVISVIMFGCSNASKDRMTKVGDTIRIVQKDSAPCVDVETEKITREFVLEKPKKSMKMKMSSSVRQYDKTIKTESIPESSQGRLIEHKTKEVTKGKLSYAFPDTMMINKISRVALVISKVESDTGEILKLTKSLINQDRTVMTSISTIKVGERMKATLLDPTQCFYITSIGANQQTIDFKDEDNYVWQWDVVPVKCGAKGSLKELDISVVIIASDGETNVPVYSKQVFVQLDSSYKITFILDFIKTYWIIFSGACVGLVTVSGWFHIKKKRKRNLKKIK